MPMHWEGVHNIEEAYAQGHGVLFLTPHLGCFEITAPSGAAHFGPTRGSITVLYRPARQPWLRELLSHARERAFMKAVPTNMDGVRQLLKALRRGEAVGLLPDQVPPSGLGVWSEMWGREAYTMTRAARLALQTGCEVRLVWGERLPAGRSRVIYPPEPLDAIKDIDGAIRHALLNPIDQDPLPAQLFPGMKLTIAFDDVSLPLPKMCRPDIRQRVIEAVLDLVAHPERQRQAMRTTMDRLGKGGEAPGLRAARSVLAHL